MEGIKRIYVNIKLPVDIYHNGEFKMLYDKMQIKMETPTQLELTSLHKKVTEIEKEIEERIQDNLLDEEEPEIKIYQSNYPPKKYKKRWNTTFKKNIKGNKLTKKNYLVIDETYS